MEIIISNSSDKPIYEQICMQVKSFIMDGKLSAGEALPSMRALAKDLHISVITVQRAYEDLTRDGFIETVSWANDEYSKTILRGITRGDRHG